MHGALTANLIKIINDVSLENDTLVLFKSISIVYLFLHFTTVRRLLKVHFARKVLLCYVANNKIMMFFELANNRSA